MKSISARPRHRAGVGPLPAQGLKLFQRQGLHRLDRSAIFGGRAGDAFATSPSAPGGAQLEGRQRVDLERADRGSKQRAAISTVDSSSISNSSSTARRGADDRLHSEARPRPGGDDGAPGKVEEQANLRSGAGCARHQFPQRLPAEPGRREAGERRRRCRSSRAAGAIRGNVDWISTGDWWREEPHHLQTAAPRRSARRATEPRAPGVQGDHRGVAERQADH